MTADSAAKTASLALGRSPFGKGAEKLAAALERTTVNKYAPKGWTTIVDHNDNIQIIDDRERVVATVTEDEDHNFGSEKVEANAKLIAAAPALLAEVESLRKTLADALDNMPYLFPAYGKSEGLTTEAKAWREKLQAATKSARAALTLATGGAK